MSLQRFRIFYAMSLKHILTYVWLSSSSGRGKSIDDQLLDLALMTNYSQSTFTWTVASSLSVFAQIQYCPGWSSNRFRMFYALSDIECLYNDLECFMLCL